MSRVVAQFLARGRRLLVSHRKALDWWAAQGTCAEVKVSLAPIDSIEVLLAVMSSHLRSLELWRPLVYLEFSMVWEMPKGLGASSDEESREACLFHSLQVAAAQMVFRWVLEPWKSHEVHNPPSHPTAKALAYSLGTTSPKKIQVWAVSIHLEVEVASSVVSRKSQAVVTTHHRAMMSRHAPFAPRRVVATSSSACLVGHSIPTGSHLSSVVLSAIAVPVQDQFVMLHQSFEEAGPPT